jgi:hypothetical protein
LKWVDSAELPAQPGWSERSVWRCQNALRSMYAPLVGGICLCLGLLIRPKRPKKPTILDFFDELAKAARVAAVASNQPPADERHRTGERTAAELEEPISGGFQYGIRDILMFTFAVAFVIGLTKWMWIYDIFEFWFFFYPIVIVSGFVFFRIGRSVRSTTSDRPLSRVARKVISRVMFVLMLALCYCVWAFAHLRGDVQSESSYCVLTNGFPHEWPYPDAVVSRLCDSDITPGGGSQTSLRSLRQMESTIKTTYAPLLGGICLCLGLLIPVRRTILDFFDELKAATRSSGVASNQPSVIAETAPNSIRETSPPRGDRNS